MDDKSPRASKTIALVLRLLLALLAISVVVSLFFPRLFPFSQDQAADWVRSKPSDKLCFVGIQILQVLIPPISHYFTSILGGYLYGPIDGGTLNLIGRFIGQVIAFAIAWRFAAWAKKQHVKFYERLRVLVSGDKKNLRLRALIIFTMIALPFFPDDELSYLMGLAQFPVGLFFLVTFFGHILGSFALAYLGSGEPFTGPLFIVLAVSTLVCFAGLLIASVRWRLQSGIGSEQE